MRNKTVAIIGTVGLPAVYGGFETLVENLTRHLGNNIDMTVFCSSKAYTEKRESYNGAKLVYLPLKANGLQSIPYDVLAILKSLRAADVMLILGVSGCAVLPMIRPFYRGKIIVNIDGLEWKRDKWNSFARSFLKFSEKIAVSFADTVVADNKVIQKHVMDTYNKPSALIAYGADHVSALALDNAVLQRFPFLQQPYAFSVCRIEPENNIHVILEATARLPQLQLVLVGNWQASDYGSRLQENFSQYNHLHLLDPIYDQNILNRIRSNCWIYLHGHSAGGTNPSLVEAMYLKLPVIAFDVNYNRETTENRAIYFSDAEQLGSILADINNIDILGIAEHMHSIAWRRYRWQVIAEEYAALF